jgi:hypothetical protein
MSDMLQDGAPEGQVEESAPAAEAPSALPVDWGSLKEALPEDLRGDSTLQSITSLEGLVKSYVHAQRSLGKDKIAVPDKHATDEDWNQLYRKLGVPEKAEDYTLNLEGAELSEEFAAKFRDQAHRTGVLPKQAEALAKWYSDFAREAAEAELAEEKQYLNDNVDKLKREWGDAYKDNVTKSRIALKHLIPDDAERQEIMDLGVGKSAAFIKLLNKAAGFFSEDVFVGQGAGQFTSLTPEAALDKARSIQGDMNHPYRNREHPNHEAAKKEVADLYRIAFPD